MKQKEIIKLSKEDLQDKLVENQKQLEELRMTHSISPLENPLEIKRLRRIVARIKTTISN
jgi:large subunit ribosomal protein L29